jgi:hypothetical protein
VARRITDSYLSNFLVRVDIGHRISKQSLLNFFPVDHSYWTWVGFLGHPFILDLAEDLLLDHLLESSSLDPLWSLLLFTATGCY